MSNMRIQWLAILFIGLVSCGSQQSKNNPNYIKVGIESGPEYDVAKVAQKVAKEKYGLEVEYIVFNDYVMPNEALNNGDIDLNVFQNRPYLDIQEKQRNYHFAIVGNTFVYPLAGYSKKITQISQLKDGHSVVIPNDPTNGGRALLLLQKAGLIKLKDGVGLFPTVNDITANPRNLTIIELEAPQLPRALEDKNVTIAVINNTFASGIGLVAGRDGLFVEDSHSPYVNIIVSRPENKNAKNVEKFVKAYQSPEVAHAADRIFKGGAIKGW